MKKRSKAILALGLAFSGLAFGAYTNQADADEVAAKPMYRMYNPNSGEHFYTASTGEANNLIKLTWRYEGIGWYAPETGDPVYRVYNPNAGDHHYTTSKGEKDSLVKNGWKDEGIGWQSDINKTVSIYRAYNPNAKKAGSHNFTASSAEQNSLIYNSGWRNEGIAWYATKKPAPTDTGDWKLVTEYGSYTLPAKEPVMAEPKTLSEIIAYLPQGKEVYYDKVVNYDGKKWVSYVDATEVRRYVEVKTDTTPTTPTNPTTPTEPTNPTDPGKWTLIPENGTYTFKNRADVRAEPRKSSPSLAYYDAGQTVRYDNKVKFDGEEWISYVSSQGNRRYIKISGDTAPTTPTTPGTWTLVPADGTYVFSTRSYIKTEPRKSAPAVAYYDAGMSVHYDKKVYFDNAEWISYFTSTGKRFYVQISSNKMKSTDSQVHISKEGVKAPEYANAIDNTVPFEVN